MVTEVTSDLLLHFLVGSAVAAVTTATIFSLFPHGESHVDHVGLRHAPALVIRVRRLSVFTWMSLIVSVCPLIEVGTSLLPTLVDSRHQALTLISSGGMGTTSVTGSYGRSRCVSP
jgi:hypothetical protein